MRQIVARVILSLVIVACAQTEVGGSAADLTPELLLARTTQRYRTARTYSDQGRVVSQAPMRLRIVRLLSHGRYEDRFETTLNRTHSSEFRHVMVNGTARAARETGRGALLLPGPRTMDSWNAALAAVSGVTLGAPLIPSDLFFATSRPEGIQSLRGIYDVGRETIGRTPCRVVAGRTARSTLKLWIAPDFTVRRVQRFVGGSLLSDIVYERVSLK